MSRPATFDCAWCGTTKPLARTGRMPKFCSDYCRRQPVAAEFQLQNAVYTRDAAQRTIDRLTANLERYRALERPETDAGSSRARDAETSFRDAGAAETSAVA